MTILGTDYFSGDPKVDDLYRSIKDPLQGMVSEWTPEIVGETTAGTPTYTSQYGVCLSYGQVIDVWFSVEWSAHAGSAGNLNLSLPCSVYPLPSVFPFKGSLQISLFDLTAGYTYALISPVPDTEFARVVECSPDKTKTATNVAICPAGSLKGHVRFLRKYDG